MTQTKPLIQKPHPARGPILICQGGHAGKAISLLNRLVLIGSAKQCHLRLRAASLAPIQAVLVHSAGGIFVRNLAAASLKINDQPQEQAWLRDGDQLQLDEFRFTLRNPESTAIPVPAAWLEYDRQTLHILRPVVAIGTGDLCDIRLNPHTDAVRSTVHPAVDAPMQALVCEVQGKHVLCNLIAPGDAAIDPVGAELKTLRGGDRFDIAGTSFEFQSEPDRQPSGNTLAVAPQSVSAQTGSADLADDEAHVANIVLHAFGNSPPVPATDSELQGNEFAPSRGGRLSATVLACVVVAMCLACLAIWFSLPVSGTVQGELVFSNLSSNVDHAAFEHQQWQLFASDQTILSARKYLLARDSKSSPGFLAINPQTSGLRMNWQWNSGSAILAVSRDSKELPHDLDRLSSLIDAYQQSVQAHDSSIDRLKLQVCQAELDQATQDVEFTTQKIQELSGDVGVAQALAPSGEALAETSFSAASQLRSFRSKLLSAPATTQPAGSSPEAVLQEPALTDDQALSRLIAIHDKAANMQAAADELAAKQSQLLAAQQHLGDLQHVVHQKQAALDDARQRITESTPTLSIQRVEVSQRKDLRPWLICSIALAASLLMMLRGSTEL